MISNTCMDRWWLSHHHSGTELHISIRMLNAMFYYDGNPKVEFSASARVVHWRFQFYVSPFTCSCYIGVASNGLTSVVVIKRFLKEIRRKFFYEDFELDKSCETRRSKNSRIFIILIKCGVLVPVFVIGRSHNTSIFDLWSYSKNNQLFKWFHLEPMVFFCSGCLKNQFLLKVVWFLSK